jgi:hypothetical protein
MFRLGTWPTGTRATSVRVAISTTDTELDPAFATETRRRPGVNVSQSG